MQRSAQTAPGLQCHTAGNLPHNTAPGSETSSASDHLSLGIDRGSMENFAVYATMKAKQGKEKEVESFLESLLRFAEAEKGTKRWFALRGHDRTYSIFDTFDDRESRGSHLEGQIAQALQEHASELFEDGLQLITLDVLTGSTAMRQRDLS